MRARATLVLAFLFLTASLSAKDVYLSVGGSVGNFRTDARIFNPSFDKDITIAARYLPAGNSDNSGVAPVNITVAKRTQVVYDDVVQSLFGGGAALGAVRLTSDDDFVASQRIYANEAIGTLGQFVPGLDHASALKKGVLVQLKTNGPRGTKGTFRTNWGGVNPNGSVANISFKLYDKHNALAGTNNLTLQPYGVFSPTSVGGFFGNPSNDLSDAWISFESDQPIFIYGSVLDNGSEDPTFIPAAADSGVEPHNPPPPVKTVRVTAVNWQFQVDPSAPLRPGDQVRFIINAEEGTHGFHLSAPNGQQLIDINQVGSSTVERLVTLPAAGTYTYFCTFSACGAGHTTMNGTFDVP